MTSDRAGRRHRAEVLLRQGLLDEAIAEYARLAAEQPDDRALASALGNLYLRARRADLAADQFCPLAERLHGSGDAASAFTIYSRFLRLLPARTQLRAGAASALKAMAAESSAAGRQAEALANLRRALEYEPSDTMTRLQVVRGSLDAGDVATARACLSNADGMPALLLCQLEVALLDGDASGARDAAERLLHDPHAPVAQIVQLAHGFATRCPQAAFGCLEPAVDRAANEQDWSMAVGALQEFASRVPGHVPSLMRLVEICVDGGLDTELRAAQRLLADAYLQAGQAREARVIAEDLALGEPWDPGNIERFRKALVMLGEPDPDALIADRLCADSPFAAEPFAAAEDPPSAKSATPDPPSAKSPTPDSRSAKSPTRSGRSPTPDPRSGSTPTPEPAAAPPVRTAAAPFPNLPPDLTALAVTPEQRAALVHYAAGRTADAVAALKRAVRSPVHRFESAMLIGRVQEGAGDLQEAIEWYERATQAAPARGAAHDVLYDLGRLLLATGEKDRALAVFLELRAEAPNYRDVSWQIARLKHAREDTRDSARVAG